MKNVIITCADQKIENFILNHWLRSLKENVNLKNIDIVIIDYGLSKKIIEKLKDQGVIIFKGQKKYHIVNKRFFDAGKYLTQNKYNQVLFIDGGDVIFQDDFNDIFQKDKNYFRVVPVGLNVLFFEWVIHVYGNFSKKNEEKIWKIVKNKPVINAGVIFSPYKKFLQLCLEQKKLIKNKDAFGPDQIVVNYFIYQSKYKFIDEKYNFQMSTNKEGFLIKQGLFYKKNGEKIVIVHNSGQTNFFRLIDNFGYGKKHNKLKKIIYIIKKNFYKIIGFYKKYLLFKNRNKRSF